VVDDDDDDDETISPLTFPPLCGLPATPSMFKKQRTSTGLVPSSSGVVAPRDAGDARENGEDDAVGDGVEQ